MARDGITITGNTNPQVSNNTYTWIPNTSWNTTATQYFWQPSAEDELESAIKKIIAQGMHKTPDDPDTIYLKVGKYTVMIHGVENG